MIQNTFTHTYIEPHQVNAFVYCKRQWYVRNRLKLPIWNEDMEIGAYVAENHWLDTEKRKELYIVSDLLRMKAKIDYITREGDRQIPIEIKKGRWNGTDPRKSDESQLLCEVLLLEEHFEMKYEYGYLLYVGSKCKYKVMVTPDKRRWIKNVIRSILSYIKSGKVPCVHYDEKKCKRCSLNDYCWCV